MLSSSFVAVPGINIELPEAVSAKRVDTRPLTVVISSENIIYIEDRPYAASEIEEYFREKNVDSIFIRADKKASVGTIVAVWDICKKLNINRIGIATTYQEQ